MGYRRAHSREVIGGMALRSVRVFEVCSGIGGLGLGLADALRRRGARARVVGHVEWDAYAAAVLVARMADASMDPAPIWPDLATFDATPWRGAVDLVASGVPCQPFSVAGSQRGAEDERYLWPHLARVLDDTGAPVLFLENVRGLLTVQRGAVFETILRDLAARGFDAEWDVFRAADVGAPHRRARLFLLAWRVPDAERDPVRHESERGEGAARSADARDAEPRNVGSTRGAVADADRGGREGLGVSEHAGERGASGRLALGHGGDGQLDRALGWPPGPGDADGWERWIARGGPQPAIRRGAHGLPDGLDESDSRTDRLRALGNAVVPAQAELAFEVLSDRAGVTL